MMPWIWRVLLILGLVQVINITLTLCKPVSGHQASHRKLHNAQIEAIKKEILTKLGMNKVPSIRNVTLTVEEKREKLKLLEKSKGDTNGKVRELFSKDEFFAKKFHSFSQSGEYT